ncbi:PAS fold protein [Thalassoglobus neptunius]|uniref:PAS fold protein n=2 Tax=Thalassoglobus neptunius TaxID=1938619 RepID=A0A5C5WNW0_9PLAN|nr:PAS fold protein [Thalassoglobus neptunius]
MENWSSLGGASEDVAILRSRYDTLLQRIVSLALTTQDFDAFEADVLRRLDVEFGGVAAAVWDFDQETKRWKIIHKSPSWDALTPNLTAVAAGSSDFRYSIETRIPGQLEPYLFAINARSERTAGLLSSRKQDSLTERDLPKTQLVIIDPQGKKDRPNREVLQRFADSFSLARQMVNQRVSSHFSARVHSALVVTSPVPVVTCSPEGIVLECNRASENVFGIRNADVQGRPVAEIGAGDFREMSRQCSENRLPVQRCVKWNSPSGESWSMDVTMCPVLSASDEVVSLTLIANDRSSLDLSLRGQKCQEEICSILAESGTLAECWPEVLRCLCTSLQFDEGSVWSTGHLSLWLDGISPLKGWAGKQRSGRLMTFQTLFAKQSSEEPSRQRISRLGFRNRRQAELPRCACRVSVKSLFRSSMTSAFIRSSFFVGL